MLDCNTVFGARPVRGPDASPAALLRLMDRNGVAGAVTSSLDGLTYNDAEGNRATLALCGDEPRLLPAAVVMPGRYLDWRSHLEEALDAGCLLVKLFVDEHRWTAPAQRFQDVVAPWPAALSATPAARAPPGEEIAPFADATAGTGVPVDPGRHELRHARRVPGGHGAPPARLPGDEPGGEPSTVEVVAQAVGPGRLVFGSGAPLRPVAGALHAVLGAALPDREKGLILGGTLAGLLRIDPAGVPAPARPPASALLPRRRVLDVHTHLGAGTWRFPIPSSGVQGLTGVLRDAGVERAIASSIYAITTDLRAGNERLVAALAAAPELLGYVTVNPQHPEQSAAESGAWTTNHEAGGGEDPRRVQQDPHLGPGDAPALRADRAIPETGEDPQRRGGLDAGPGGPRRRLPGPADHRRPRRGVGLRAVLPRPPERVLRVLQLRSRAGADRRVPRRGRAARLLFGSDADLLSPRFMLGVYADASIPEDVAPLVYYENAARLFRV